MASNRRTVEFFVEQAAAAGAVSARPMFGEYGLYCDGKMVGIIGEDQLFIKPTATGRSFAGGADEVSPYPGAKPCLLIEPDRWDDAEWMSLLVRMTAAELPPPKTKPTKRPK